MQNLFVLLSLIAIAFAQYQGAAQPVYQAAQPTYQAAQPTYQAAQPTYQAAQPTYQAAQPTYQAAYQAAQPTYQAAYQAPTPSYGYQAPTPSYGYQAPTPSYGYSAPSTYSAPSSQPKPQSTYEPTYDAQESIEAMFEHDDKVTTLSLTHDVGYNVGKQVVGNQFGYIDHLSGELSGQVVGSAFVLFQQGEGFVTYETLSLVLQNGDSLACQGVFVDTVPGADFVLSVTGGTGVFEGATGQVFGTTVDPSKQWKYVVVLDNDSLP